MEAKAMKKQNIKNETLFAWAVAQLNKKTREAIKQVNKNTAEAMRENYPDENALLCAWWIKKNFTKREINKMQGFKFDAIVKAYKAREVENIKKAAEKTKEEIKTVCDASMPEFIDVVVEWKKNRTWGANPRAEIRTGENCFISRSVGGCGYDKESAATAEVFNKDNGIKKAALVALFRNAHQPKTRRYIYGVNFFYTHAPYFEGGCGFSSHRHVLELAGYELKNSNSGKMFNTYYFV